MEGSPAAYAHRIKFYEKEIKEKGIQGQEVDIKYRVLVKESTKAKQKRTEGLTSLEGIEKAKKETPEIADDNS